MDPTYYGLNTSNLFAFITDRQTQCFLLSAHRSISICELWDWLRLYDPIHGFMFDKSAECQQIREQMKTDDINETHSGSSYAHILREMQYIAKNGYPQYSQEYIKGLN